MYKRPISALATLALFILACGPLSSSTTNSDILFEDDFSTSNQNWDILTDDPEILLDYSDGGYRMTALAEDIVFSSVPQVDLPSDVSIEVDITQIAGTSNTAMGIICRNSYSSNGNSMYFFMITNDGTAKIAKYILGQKTQLVGNNDIIPAIQTGKATNHMRVDCIGNQLTMFVNDIQLFSITDDSLGDGDSGLMLGTADAEDAVVLFDNFVVRQP